MVIGANVVVACGEYRQNAQTTADGSYSISVPQGAYQLKVQSPGFEPATRLVALDQPATHLDLTLAVGHAESIVSVSADQGFVATSSTSATKTGAALIETPQSISVVTLDQLNQRDVQNLNQALQYTAGRWHCDLRF